jgi:hypothetical protein
MAGKTKDKPRPCSQAATERKLLRQERVAHLVGEGVRLAELYHIIRAEFGVGDRTIRLDLIAIGADVKKQLGHEGALYCEIGRALDRIRRRAETEPSQYGVTSAVAQRADEWLMRFLVGSVDKRRLVQLGLDVQKHEAAIAELTERKMAAQAELAEAEAQLARARSKHVDRPLAVYLVDLAGDVSDEEAAAASPTLAAELEHAEPGD